MNTKPAFREVMGGRGERQSPTFYKITTIASVMKESLRSFESLDREGFPEER